VQRILQGEAVEEEIVPLVAPAPIEILMEGKYAEDPVSPTPKTPIPTDTEIFVFDPARFERRTPDESRVLFVEMVKIVGEIGLSNPVHDNRFRKIIKCFMAAKEKMGEQAWNAVTHNNANFSRWLVKAGKHAHLRLQKALPAAKSVPTRGPFLKNIRKLPEIIISLVALGATPSLGPALLTFKNECCLVESALLILDETALSDPTFLAWLQITYPSYRSAAQRAQPQPIQMQPAGGRSVRGGATVGRGRGQPRGRGAQPAAANHAGDVAQGGPIANRQDHSAQQGIRRAASTDMQSEPKRLRKD